MIVKLTGGFERGDRAATQTRRGISRKLFPKKAKRPKGDGAPPALCEFAITVEEG
jgi:hypothetical protein